MTDGILDLLGMIMVLAIVLALGFSLILPLINTELMQYNETIEDKAMLSVIKDATDAEISKVDPNVLVPTQPVFTGREIVLMSQVQDVCMPQPRSFLVGANRIEVTSTYRLAMRATGIVLWNTLPDTARTDYTVNFNYGNHAIIGDESFEIK